MPADTNIKMNITINKAITFIIAKKKSSTCVHHKYFFHILNDTYLLFYRNILV